MAAHRYWRLYIETIQPGNYNYDAIGHLDFYEAGVLVTDTSGQIAASSHYAYFTPDRIFTGGAGVWISDNQTPCWVSYDFGVPRAIDSLTFAPDNGGNYPQTMFLESSDDAATWTREWGIVPPTGGWTNEQSYTFNAPPPVPPPPPGEHRFWRLKWDASPRGFCSCSALQLRDVVGGPDVTQGSPGSAIDGTNYGGYGAANAFDNDPGTFWSSNGPADYVGWDFGAGNYFHIVEYVYAPRNDGSSNDDGPRPGGLEFSDDGVAWTRSNTLMAPGNYDSGSTYTFENTPPPPQEASKLGVYVVEGSSLPLFASKLGEYIVEGSPYPLLASKLASYVVEGPPPPVPPASDHYGQMMVG